MGTPSMGFDAIMLSDTSGSISSGSEAWEYIDWGFAQDEEIKETDGIRGTRSLPDERTRAGIITPGGPVTFAVDTNFLNTYLPRILGGSRTGAGPTFTYPLADTLPTFSLGISRVAKDFFYSNAVVNRATFRGSAGELVTVELDIQATAETVLNSGTFLAYNVTLPANPPFMFFDCATSGFTIGGSQYPIFDFELTIDNMLITDRYMNSQTRANLPPRSRVVTIRTNNPFSSTETALYGTADTAAVAFVLTLTNGTHVTTFTMANVRFPTKSPVINRKEEIRLPLFGQARSLGTGGSITRELVTTQVL